MNNQTRFKIVTELIETQSTASSPITSSTIKEYFKNNYDMGIDSRTIREIVEQYNEGSKKHEIIRIPDSNPAAYYLNEEDGLTIDEARLMVDVVSSSKFFPLNTKKRIIKSLSELFPERNRKKLEKNMILHIEGNESYDSFYSTYSTLIDAIQNRNKISFDYERTGINGPSIRHYDHYAPLETYYDNNTLYLYIYDSVNSKIKTFRIDYITNIILEDHYLLTDTILQLLHNEIQNTVYMYGSDHQELLELTFENYQYANIVDRFGKNIDHIHKVDDSHFSVLVECPISSTFYSWVIGFGGKIKITGPEKQVEAYHKFLENCK